MNSSTKLLSLSLNLVLVFALNSCSSTDPTTIPVTTSCTSSDCNLSTTPTPNYTSTPDTVAAQALKAAATDLASNDALNTVTPTLAGAGDQQAATAQLPKAGSGAMNGSAASTPSSATTGSYVNPYTSGSGSSGSGSGTSSGSGGLATTSGTPSASATGSPSSTGGGLASTGADGALTYTNGSAARASGSGGLGGLTNPFAALSGGADGAGGGAGKSSLIDFDGKKSGTDVAASGSTDPADYFSMTSETDNLFKIIERRYQKTTLAWASVTANAVLKTKQK